MGFFEIFIAVLAIVGAIAVGGTILAFLCAGYFVVTDSLRDEHPSLTLVVDVVALILLITLLLTCFVYFGQ